MYTESFSGVITDVAAVKGRYTCLTVRLISRTQPWIGEEVYICSGEHVLGSFRIAEMGIMIPTTKAEKATYIRLISGDQTVRSARPGQLVRTQAR